MEARTKKLIGLGALIVALLSIALSGDDVDEIVAQERAKAVSYTQIPKLIAWGFFLNSFTCV